MLKMVSLWSVNRIIFVQFIVSDFLLRKHEIIMIIIIYFC